MVVKNARFRPPYVHGLGDLYLLQLAHGLNYSKYDMDLLDYIVQIWTILGIKGNKRVPNDLWKDIFISWKIIDQSIQVRSE